MLSLLARHCRRKIYDVFLERLKDRVSENHGRRSHGEQADVARWCSEKAMKSILNYIEIGKKKAD